VVPVDISFGNPKDGVEAEEPCILPRAVRDGLVEIPAREHGVIRDLGRHGVQA
jgi:hypothetical protein